MKFHNEEVDFDIASLPFSTNMRKDKTNTRAASVRLWSRLLGAESFSCLYSEVGANSSSSCSKDEAATSSSSRATK